MIFKPQYRDPIGIKKQYIKFVLRYKDFLYQQWLKDLERFVKNFDKYRIIKLDAVDLNPFANIMSSLKALSDAAFTKPDFILGVGKTGQAIGTWNKNKYNSVPAFKLLGFNDIPVKKERALLDGWTGQNVRLIAGITEEQAKNIENLFYQASSEGTPQKEILNRLSTLLDGDDYRFKLVTDDQLGKLNTNLDRIKQQEAGLEEFIWRTVGDGSVRSLHRAREGEKYSWKKGPWPGQEPRCRCYAEPYIEGSLGDLLKEESEKHTKSVRKKLGV